jgi:hypothetical protein
MNLFKKKKYHQKFHNTIKNVFDPNIPIESCKKPSPNWFTDPKILEVEKNTVFNNNWIPVGSTHHLNKIGGFFTGDLLNERFSKN